MKYPLSLWRVSVLGSALLAGCVANSAAPPPQETTKYSLDNTEKFVVLDQPAQSAVTCTGLQERTLADGRLEVVANVRNHENRSIQVQLDCVFKDEQNAPIGETPFQPMLLSENETEAVRFTATSPLAKNYTIRVKQGP